MNNWKEYLEDGEGHKHKKRKINKEFLCKKNKQAALCLFQKTALEF